MAEYPIRFIIVRVIPETIDGSDSGIKTFNTIWGTVAPIARLDSITPFGVSLRLLSITLATKGAAAMERGTIVAVVPIVFPTISFEMGKTMIISIIKGIDLNTFIIPPKTLLNMG